jgi:hypothetical protein
MNTKGHVPTPTSLPLSEQKAKRKKKGYQQAKKTLKAMVENVG